MSEVPESTGGSPAENLLRSLELNDKIIIKILAQLHKLQDDAGNLARENQAKLEAEIREIRAELSDIYSQVSPPKPVVVCCGMVRSGSTVQYQVVADLLEQRGLGQRIGFVEKKNFRDVRLQLAGASELSVVKLHDFLPELEPWLRLEKSQIFYTYRDLRSVAASVMRIWKSPFSEVMRPNGWLENAVAADARWRAFPKVVVSRYEDIVQSLPREVGRWAAALGLELTPQQLEEVSARYSIPAQQERIRQAGLPEEGASASAIETFDPKSLLHARHITDGSVDGWKNELEPAQVREIENRYTDWLLANGFKLETTG